MKKKIVVRRELMGEIEVRDDIGGFIEIYVFSRELEGNKNSRIEQRGLYVSELDEKYFRLVPPSILRMVGKENLIIELPEKLALVSSRKDIAYQERFLPIIQRAVVVAMLKSALNLYIFKGVALLNLSLDFVQTKIANTRFCTRRCKKK
jgi:hypothetical protein